MLVPDQELGENRRCDYHNDVACFGSKPNILASLPVVRMHRFLPILFGALAIFVSHVECSLGQGLQYDLKKGQKASYEYDIQIDTSANLITYNGIVNYEVTMVNDQFIRLRFQGGLVEQTKPNTNREQDFGRNFPRFPSIPNIFTRNSFSGKVHSKNVISLTRSGQVLTLDGSSQLPFLLGNLSLIPFEQLPKDKQSTWKSDSGVSISEESNDLRFMARPFGPFAFQTAEHMQSASELASYSILRTESGIVTIEKTFELKTPDTGDRESFQMTGKGTWSFDTEYNLPSGTDMQYSLSIKDGNTTTTFPIRVKFSKLSVERLAAMQAEAKANQEKAQKLQEELKVAAATPIIGNELEELLSDLASTTATKKHAALIKLMPKELQEADPKLVEAVRKIAKSDDFCASLADNILQKIDPIHRLNKQYEGSGFVESTEIMVDAATDLFVGQIVQIKEHGSTWYAAEITELLTDGKVATRYRGWGQRPATVLRNQIQLAPKEVIQPKRREKSPTSPTQAVSSAAARTWSDSSGSFKVEATYLGLSEDKVVLRKMDGQEVSVPLFRLSIQDQRFVANAIEESKQLGNPFEK